MGQFKAFDWASEISELVSLLALPFSCPWGQLTRNPCYQGQLYPPAQARTVAHSLKCCNQLGVWPVLSFSRPWTRSSACHRWQGTRKGRTVSLLCLCHHQAYKQEGQLTYTPQIQGQLYCVHPGKVQGLVSLVLHQVRDRATSHALMSLGQLFCLPLVPRSRV